MASIDESKILSPTIKKGKQYAKKRPGWDLIEEVQGVGLVEGRYARESDGKYDGLYIALKYRGIIFAPKL
ncbi:hypothetical protein [Paraflavitalea speifideaquila]|uniref:hypothetical protein n=1 Tax=Paraflavitalea speifideaquila TaxID=3076558 RepID=UPI0028E99A40|nr:hypothetical protein [Paraflavitalea speifideiaquila]